MNLHKAWGEEERPATIKVQYPLRNEPCIEGRWARKVIILTQGGPKDFMAIEGRRIIAAHNVIARFEEKWAAPGGFLKPGVVKTLQCHANSMHK